MDGVYSLYGVDDTDSSASEACELMAEVGLTPDNRGWTGRTGKEPHICRGSHLPQLIIAPGPAWSYWSYSEIFFSEISFELFQLHYKNIHIEATALCCITAPDFYLYHRHHHLAQDQRNTQFTSHTMPVPESKYLSPVWRDDIFSEYPNPRT